MYRIQSLCFFSRTTRAYFRLVFRGDISDIKDEVRRVIEEKATRVAGEDYNVMLIDKFVVGISSIFPDGFSTPKPPPTGITESKPSVMFSFMFISSGDRIAGDSTFVKLTLN